MPQLASSSTTNLQNGRVNVAQTLLSVLLMLGTRVKFDAFTDFFTNSEPPHGSCEEAERRRTPKDLNRAVPAEALGIQRRLGRLRSFTVLRRSACGYDAFGGSG